jgi:SAM-dependent methyltransferase
LDRWNLAYWNALSAGWTVAPPLAPCEDDLAWFSRSVRRACEDLPEPPHALLFGVTPGLALLDWPVGTQLTAFDWSARMLHEVLPRAGNPAHTVAVLADWRQLPVASRSCDVIVGDGCYTALGDLEGATLMNAEMHRVLRPGSSLCLRCFVRPPRMVGIAEVFADSANGMNFDLFRWRLAVAVQGDRWGVPLGEVWQAWDERVPDRPALAAQRGWSLADLQRIERWKGEGARYAFASLAQLRELAAPQFTLLETDIPSYSMGEYFPRIVLQARR